MAPLFIFLIALFGCSVALDDWDQYQLVWQDEFDTLDFSKWQHEVTATGGGNYEFQVYTPSSENSYVSDGRLFIKPSLLVDSVNPKTGEPYGETFLTQGVLDIEDLYGACTNPENDGCYRSGTDRNIPPVMSARLRSFERFSFKYGRAVVRAKMPVGDWMWPAIWMLPEDWVYGEWPVSGEIDIIESIGNRDYVDVDGQKVGIQKMGSTLHWGPDRNNNRYYLTSEAKWNYTDNYGDYFHTFILDWSENGISFYVDDENTALLNIPNPLIPANEKWVDFWQFGQPWWPSDLSNPWINGTNFAPFDQGFHFILNVAVGGLNGFIPDNCVNRDGAPTLQKPWNNGDDYVNALNEFNNRKSDWKWTWDLEEDNAAMQVDYIRVYQRK